MMNLERLQGLEQTAAFDCDIALQDACKEIRRLRAALEWIFDMGDRPQWRAIEKAGEALGLPDWSSMSRIPVIPNECWILGNVEAVEEETNTIHVLVERTVDFPNVPNFAASQVGYHIGIISAVPIKVKHRDRIEAVISFRGDEHSASFVLKEYQVTLERDFMLRENDVIELLSMPDEPNPPPMGTRGTVQAVLESGPVKQIIVDWDDGSTLMLVEGTDRYRLVSRP